MEWLNFHHLRYFWVVAREGSVSRAARKLRVTQPTVSEQVRALQEALGEKLLRREGRGVAVTDAGQTVLRFAEEIFALGGELVDSVKGRPSGRPLRLSVGIADVVPKLVAFRILEPALAMTLPVRLVCREDAQDRLLPALVGHELDMVIADAPAGPALAAGPGRAYSHLLGECGVSVFASARLAQRLRPGFPRSLDGAPILLPTSDTAMRRELDAWFDSRRIAPSVVAEVQDAALLATFAEAGLGVFAAPDAIAPETGLARGLRRVGALKPLRARYYAITVERRIEHPAVALIAGTARETLFGRGRTAPSS
ncbi:MAG TPA: LysR family transcriptional regulator [Labilithrix sp.]|nr:LysR family transcriptional regulator [Labilithrix sp.]